MRKGLVSVSFRKLSPMEIITLCKRCDLSEIEWGGDIHVPLGNIQRAKEVVHLMQEEGLVTNCYGSYVRMKQEERKDFPALLDTARALGAPMIRVWAGVRNDDDLSEITESTQELCDLAKDIKITFEYHGNTLTHDEASAYALLKAIHRANARSQWQPPVNLSEEGCLHSIAVMREYIENIHVFSWCGREKLPLADHRERWKKYFAALPGDRAAMLEFVQDNDPQNLIRDARTLDDLLKEGEIK